MATCFLLTARCGRAGDSTRHSIDAAVDAGADVRFETKGEVAFDTGGRVTGIRTPHGAIDADLVVAATGAPGAVARQLGAERDPNEPFGLAIRAYVESPRHDDRYLEACLTIRDGQGTWVPGLRMDVPLR